MTPQSLIEAALFSAHQPLKIETLLEVLQPQFPELDKAAVAELLDELQADYAARGVILNEVASGWRFQVNAELGPALQPLFEEKPQRYSRALLETLALVAYRQPITRAEIEQVRGVVVSTQIMKTLTEHNWVRIVGHKDVPGRPALYATTKHFLDHFNLKSLDNLPALSEIVGLNEATDQIELALVEAEAGQGTLIPSDASDEGVEAPERPSVELDAEVEADAVPEPNGQSAYEEFTDIVITESLDDDDASASTVSAHDV